MARSAIPEGWKRLEIVYTRALEMAPEKRSEFLTRECADDPATRSQIESLLSHNVAAAALFDRLEPLVRQAPKIVGFGQAIGTRIGPYEIVGEIGCGGMGVVYEAYDGRLARKVALKFLPPWLSADREARERFIGEAKAASATDHPNIATLHEIGETPDGTLYLVLALYAGETLKTRLTRGPLDPVESLDIARQIAAGLAAAHRREIVHRDIKPANLFLTEDGLVKILDFGIAKIAGADVTASSGMRGTLAYMSPEQARGEEVDGRSDLWSLGVVLYEMITGQRPFRGESDSAVMRAILEDVPPPLAGLAPVPDPLIKIVERLLEKRPDKRSATALTVAGDLELVSLQRASPLARKSRALSLMTSLVGAAALFVLLLSLPDMYGTGDARPEHPMRAAVTKLAAQPSLAVLPFQNLSRDTLDSYLAAALPEDIAARLGRDADVRIKSPSTFSGLQAAERSDPIEAGRTLGVEYIVEGSVRRSADHIRVTARLVETTDGFQLWSNVYDVGPADLLAVQAEIAARIASGIRLVASGEDRGWVGGPTRNTEAYDHYLRGNFYLAQRTPKSVRRAIREYRTASQLDSTFVAARVRQAYAYGLFLDWGWVYPGYSETALLQEGLAMTEEALRRTPRSSEAWMAHAYLLVAGGDWVGSIQAFERAVTLDHQNPEAHYQYGQTLMIVGLYEQAVDAYLNALALEPDRAMALVSLHGIRYRQGRLSEARSLIDRAIAIDPAMSYAYAVRAGMLVTEGDCHRARSDAEMAFRIDSTYAVPSRAMLAAALFCAGDELGAERQLELSLAAMPDPENPSSTDAHFIAKALIEMERAGEALEVLERVPLPTAWLAFYLQSPEYHAIRQNSRFRKILRDAAPDKTVRIRPPR